MVSPTWKSGNRVGTPRSGGIEIGRPLLAQTGNAFVHIRPGKPHEFERQRGIEGGPGQAQPAVECVLGPADGRLRARRQPLGDLEGAVDQVLLRHRQGHQPDPLGFVARHRFAQQQVILGLGHAAQQRPDDRGMVPSGHAQPGMAVDDARILGRDRDIRQQSGDQPCAHRRAVHGTDDGLVAVDEVVDQVARLVPDAGAHLEIVGHLLDQVQVAAGRKALPLAADQRHAHRRLGRHVAPDLGQLTVQAGIGGGQLAVGRLRRPHHDLEDGAVLHERQRLVTGKAWGERVHGWAECESSIADRAACATRAGGAMSSGRVGQAPFAGADRGHPAGAPVQAGHGLARAC